jgi:DNA-binding transcriptional ArsR family regulator
MALKTTKQPLRSEIRLPAVLHALGDPIRLEIVRQIDAEGKRECGTFHLDMPKSSLSHHFRVLREAGVVGTRPNGTALLNWLRTEDLEALFPDLLPSVLQGIRKPSKRSLQEKSRKAPARQRTEERVLLHSSTQRSGAAIK